MNMPEKKPDESLKSTAINYIWQRELTGLSWWHALYFHLLRTLYVVIRDLGDGQLTLRAMSLVYTTLLSMVPLIAISFSVLKGFGAHNQVEPFLYNVLAPLGDKGIEIASRIIGFVENMKVGVLGSLGLILLLYTVISLMQKIERSFNYTWHVSQPRRLSRRFSDYLSVVLIGPVLIAASLGISATVMSASVVEQVTSIAPIGNSLKVIGTLVPFILSAAAFTFIYVFIPNTKVRFTSALVGAITAAVLWKLTGWVFASFIVTSGNYAAVYSAFASLIFFMIWLYLSWLILLIGSAVAFYHQHPEYRVVSAEGERVNHRMRETYALSIMQAIAQAQYSGAPAWTIDALARALRTSMSVIDEIITDFETAGILARTSDDPVTLLPRRALDTLPILEILEAVRNPVDETVEPLIAAERVRDVTDSVQQAISTALAGKTVKDLISVQSAGDDSENPVYIGTPRQ